MVVGAGLAAAFLITWFFISNYGPTGSYVLENVLVSPEVLKQLNYNDWNEKISEQDRFIFDKIMYKGKEIDLESYRKIYQLLKKDISQSDVGGFSEDSNHLVIYVKTESPSVWQFISKPFQQVQFAKGGNGYRVLLHEDNQGPHWVEFFHEKVREKVEQVL